MIELFKHILHLDFDWLFANYGTVIYIVLFLVIFIETGLVAMPLLPGDSLLFTAGLFARSGHLNLSYLLILLFIAAVLGDNCNYWVGRKIGLKIFTLKINGKLIVKKEYLDKTHIFFEKHGTKAIIMARFVPIVRTFSPFAAGVAEMNYKKFVTFDILGGALWIGSLTIAGYLLGEVEFIRKHIDLVCLGIILLSVLPIIFGYLKSRMKK
ncbi:MAG: VTT domain-containing protein [Bacteroidota bacterium]|nr:VTT domain-containing protein [Bacteroidota bacterium]MDP3144260.1 VTT domain-containing protein [Bacteroidota bacterium]MDP3558315.1 VTT domain-containing protein [Bacteroidota bacterium]